MSIAESSHPWIGAFAGHLLKLNTRMNATHAVQCAVQQIHRVGHLSPEVAVRMTVTGAPQALESEPLTDHSARYRQLFAGK